MSINNGWKVARSTLISFERVALSNFISVNEYSMAENRGTSS